MGLAARVYGSRLQAREKLNANAFCVFLAR